MISFKFSNKIKTIHTHSTYPIYKKGLTAVVLISMFAFLSGCISSSGMYSIIVSNYAKGESNELNNLSTSYKDKKIIFPQAIVTMSEANQAKWLDTLKQYKVHTIDTSVKVPLSKVSGLIDLKIPACGKKGFAIVKLEAVSRRKRGKVIDVRLTYVCKDDNPDVNWDKLGKFWAATPSHKINVNDPENYCYDGFQSIEFQFLPEKENPVLRSVLMICADE